MAEDKQLAERLQYFRDKWQAKALKQATPLDRDQLEKPRRSIKDILLKRQLNALLQQRNDQRDGVFNLAKLYCWASLSFLIIVVTVQIAGRVVLEGHNFSVFSGNELQVLVSGVFLQFVGLLYIITKSLYNDKNYIDIFKDILNKY